MINLFLNGWLHHKNLIALQKYSNIQIYTDKSDIYKCSVIYSPSDYMNTEEYSDKLYIFGPHWSVFPNLNFHNLINKKNAIYIIPSQWCKDFWIKYTNNEYENIIKVLPFGVDTYKFCENKNINERDKVFIYYKSRQPNELTFIENFLKSKNIDYIIFDYKKRYNENEYLEYLQNSKYGIILDAHESQGFAIEEAMSCNVPLLIWNIKDMSQEYGQKYPNISGTTIPYWDNICGEYFYEQNEFENIYNKFINNLNNYKPRDYILENLSIQKCEEKLLNIIQNSK